MPDRRCARRVPIDILFNKYVNGYPRLCRGTDLSRTGLRATVFLEPDCAAESATIELRLPGDRESIWAWAIEPRISCAAIRWSKLTLWVNSSTRRSVA